MNEKMSFKMGVKFAASFYMGKDFLERSFYMYCMYLYAKVPEVNYNQSEGKLNQKKVWNKQEMQCCNFCNDLFN